MLDHIDTSQHPQTIELFKQLARREWPGGTLPYAVFNTLIEHEEYAVFVEVFDACHVLLDAERKEWFGIETPAYRCLKLALPPDWRYRRGSELQEALRAARVDSLVVSAPGNGDTVSEAVCDCIAMALRGGLRELQVFSPLACALPVSLAMKHCDLRQLSLVAPGGMVPIGPAWQSYEVLLEGARSADALHTLDLSFSPSQYLALAPVLRVGLEDGLTGLKQVGVSTLVDNRDGLAYRSEALHTVARALLCRQSPMKVDLRHCRADVETLYELKLMLSANPALETVLPEGAWGDQTRATQTTTSAHPVVTTGTATSAAAPNTTTGAVSLGAQALVVAGPKPKTHEEIFEGWASKFRHTAFDHNQNTLHFLATLACAEFPGESPESAALNIDADAAFCDLIEREEYAVFLEVFEACQQLRLLRHRQHGDGGEPPSRALQLRLRSGWSYQRAGELLDALLRAKVQSLIVKAWETDGVVSPAVCDCIGVLLRGGLVELQIFDTVTSPALLAQSIRHSGLQALLLSGSPELLPTAVVKGMEARYATDLLPSSNAVPLIRTASDAAWGNYATLVAGLAGCKTLHTLHLGFSPTQLYLLMSPLFAAAKSPTAGKSGLPKLKALEVATGPFVTGLDTLHVRLFMQVVAEFKTLQFFELMANGIDAACFRNAFVEPLKGHPTLREIRVRGVHAVAPTVPTSGDMPLRETSASASDAESVSISDGETESDADTSTDPA